MRATTLRHGQLLLELIRRHRRREPAEGARGRLLLPLLRHRRHAVGQRDHLQPSTREALQRLSMTLLHALP